MSVSIYDFVSGFIWSSNTITYSYDKAFYANVSDDAHSLLRQGFDTFTSGTVQDGNSTLGDAAISKWEAVANIDFQPVAENLADVGIVTRTVIGSSQGTTTPVVSGSNFVLQEFAIESGSSIGLFIHELGHVLGLDHPGHGDGSNPSFDTETTIMSYNVSTITFNHPAVTPMIYDIAAVQAIYGANLTTQNHADTYTLHSSLSQSSTVWDAGGSGIDTITVDNTASTTAATIDLRGGIDPSTGKPFWSHFGSEYMALAFNTLEQSGVVNIENAVGAAGADTLIGNTIDNTLTGNDGADQLYGGSGNDTLDGGNGADQMDGGAGSDTVSYIDSSVGVTINMTLSVQAGGHAQGDVFTSIENVTASNFADIITGDGNGNVLSGLAGADNLYGGAGNDILIGGSGADVLNGGADADTVSYQGSTSGVNVDLSLSGAQSGGDAQGDTLSNFESIIGSGLNDTLHGDSASNALYGGGGADIIYSDTVAGGGIDLLVGGTGADTYVFSTVLTGVTTPQNNFVIDDADGSLTLSIGFAYSDSSTATIDGNPVNVYSGGPQQVNLNLGLEYVASSHEIRILELSGTTILGQYGIIENVGGMTPASTITGSNFSSISVAYSHLATVNIGTAGNDSITGSSGNDTLTGGSGDDFIYGNAGGDTMYGGSGSDYLDGGIGNDALSGGTGDDTYIVDSSSDTVTENSAEGSDIVYSSASTYTLASNIEDLALTGSAAAAIGNGLANHVTGNMYDNTLTGAAGADTIAGGGGFNTASYQTSSAAVAVHLDTNVNTGGDAAGDVLYNIQGIIGSAYNDTLVGSDADETFIGGAGSDSINGGNGIDTVSYATSSVYVSGNLGTNTFFSGDAAYDTVQNVENLIGSAYNDYLGGNSGTNVLDGGVGNDSLEGFDGNDTLSGGAGDDLLFGGNGDDLLIGGPGSDYIDGGAGSDTLTFATSANWVSADLAANNFWNADAAWDNVMTNVENLTGSAFADYLNGSSVANILTGGDGNDSIVGGDGNDTIYGGNGDDNLSGSNGNDLIVAGPGSDYVDGGAGSDTLSFGDSSTWVSADLANNSYWNGDAAWDNVTNVENLIGSAFNDYLYGSTAANVLSGGNGDDHIEGRAGADTLIGGNGNDIFIFTAGGTGTDNISDFQGAGVTGGDVIQISSGIYSTAAIALTHVTYSGGDANLDLGSGHLVHLVGVTSLVAGDFAIV